MEWKQKYVKTLSASYKGLFELFYSFLLVSVREQNQKLNENVLKIIIGSWN